MSWDNTYIFVFFGFTRVYCIKQVKVSPGLYKTMEIVVWENKVKYVYCIFQFFQKEGVPNVPNEYDLFNEVTEMNLTGKGKTFLSQVCIKMVNRIVSWKYLDSPSNCR